MLEILEKCTLCPHECKVNRKNGKIGRCKSKDTVKIALYSTHNFEEPCISGNNGSGTVFFSNCNLNSIIESCLPPIAKRKLTLLIIVPNKKHSFIIILFV